VQGAYTELSGVSYAATIILACIDTHSATFSTFLTTSLRSSHQTMSWAI
jgi:hypothetical protein